MKLPNCKPPDQWKASTVGGLSIVLGDLSSHFARQFARRSKCIPLRTPPIQPKGANYLCDAKRAHGVADHRNSRLPITVNCLKRARTNYMISIETDHIHIEILRWRAPVPIYYGISGASMLSPPERGVG